MFKGKYFTGDGDHPDHNVRENRDPQHAQEERDEEPAPPLLQAAIRHCIISSGLQWQAHSPDDALFQIDRRSQLELVFVLLHFGHLGRSGRRLAHVIRAQGVAIC